MSDEGELTCPVCRAKQIPRGICRRCRADLSLYVKALQSEELVRKLFAEASRAEQDDLAARAASYLRWLRPSSRSKDEAQGRAGER